MSYAIIRNEKLTRAEAKGRCVHNDRRAKNHTNKDIDVSKSYMNFYIKKNELTYIKEFDRLKEKYDLKGQIRSNSIIVCEMVITSDENFFNKIGEKETKRYFEESYKFVCNYNNLGEKNILSAVVHLDEGVPHMHLVYIPVIHTKDKEGNNIDKICCREFWKGRDSYRNLQNAFWEYVKSKGFDLERGLLSEETQNEHIPIQKYKAITNFENTKKVLKSIKQELPEVPDIREFKKIMINRDEKIKEQIIKPKDDLIEELYQNNLELHKELSKQANVVDIAEKYQEEKNEILKENQELKTRCRNLEEEFETKAENLKNEYDKEMRQTKKKFNRIIDELDNENVKLHKIIDRFKVTVSKFITWVCSKFSVSSEEQLMRDFQKETNMNFRVEEQIEHEIMIDKEEDELDMW